MNYILTYNYKREMENDGSGTSNGLSSSFKSAANSLTLLYKDALISNKLSYEAGYKHCLSDLWSYLSSIQSSSSCVLNLADLEAFIHLSSSKLSHSIPTIEEFPTENARMDNHHKEYVMHDGKRERDSADLSSFSKKSKLS